MDITCEPRSYPKGKLRLQVAQLANYELSDSHITCERRTMAFVYVLGIARRNHSPSPLRNPLPLALTKSRTILPSKRATAILRTVLNTKKKEWVITIRVSFDLNLGKATRNRIDCSWRRKALSILGFCLVAAGMGGKCCLSSSNLDCGVETILT